MRLSFLLGCLAVINILLSLSYQWFLFTTLGAGSEGAGTTEILTSLATAFAVVGNRDSGFPLVGNATNRVGIRCRMPEPGMSETLTLALMRCSRK